VNKKKLNSTINSGNDYKYKSFKKEGITNQKELDQSFKSKSISSNKSNKEHTKIDSLIGK